MGLHIKNIADKQYSEILSPEINESRDNVIRNSLKKMDIATTDEVSDDFFNWCYLFALLFGY